MPKYDPDDEDRIYLCDCGANSVVWYGYKCRDCGKRWPVGYGPAPDEYWDHKRQTFAFSHQWFTCHRYTIRSGGSCRRCGADPKDSSK